MKHENNKRPVKCPPSTPTCANCEPPKHPCPQGVIANCCTGAGATTGRIIPPALLPPEEPISLVCTTLDTTCLCKPIIKIGFVCDVSFAFFSAVPVSLNFLLKKSCNNGQEVMCGTWTLTTTQVLSRFATDSFEFAFCDRNPCPGCCTYAVEVIVETAAGASLATYISAPTIKAIATETCNAQNVNYSLETPLCGVTRETYGHQTVNCPPASTVYADCEPKHPCPQGVIFNCGTGTDIQTTNVCPTTPLSLVCVPIDTTCLCRPLVTLDFSTVIAATIPVGNTVTLIFQVKKSCDNGQEIKCGSWTFERNVPSVNLLRSNTFRFTFCDCNPCPGCCTYSVELVFCRTFGPDVPFTGNFSINAATASVLAVDTCPQS